jgi:hypothetical protein
MTGGAIDTRLVSTTGSREFRGTTPVGIPRRSRRDRPGAVPGTAIVHASPADCDDPALGREDGGRGHGAPVEQHAAAERRTQL